MSSVPEFLLMVAFAGAGVSLGTYLRKVWSNRQASGGWFPCAVRVSGGRLAPLSGRWRHVLVAVSPGCLELRGQWYRPAAIGRFQVIAVSGPPREPSRAEWLSVAADCRIVRLQTPDAVLDWAILSRHLGEALAQLAVPGTEHASPAPAA